MLIFIPSTFLAFEGLRRDFATLLMLIFGLIAMISLTVTVLHVIQGEKESAKKALRWMIVTAVGFILFTVIKNL